ncbi:hypothetical protein NMD1_03224 [Novosphingobium sp. MD-1]|nr:hypothetical protein NMD1_03224 [Novosphingobium sp. MD-1]
MSQLRGFRNVQPACSRSRIAIHTDLVIIVGKTIQFGVSREWRRAGRMTARPQHPNQPSQGCGCRWVRHAPGREAWRERQREDGIANRQNVSGRPG